MANEILSFLKNAWDIIDKRTSFRAIQKDDMVQFLKESIEYHKELNGVYTVYSDPVWNQWYSYQVLPNLNKSTSKAKNVPQEYRKYVTGKAAQDEQQRPFKSLAEAHKSMADLLSKILNKIDTLFSDEHITLADVRISQLTVIGILRQSEMLSNFSAYLYAYMVRAAKETDKDIPKYRESFLLDVFDKAAKMVSDLRNKTGIYKFLDEVHNLKTKNVDMILGAMKGSPNVSSIMRGFSIPLIGYITSALSAIGGLFTAPFEAWNEYKIEKYERNKEIKEWLEQHNALLKMDLAEMEPYDPKYQQTLKIIQAYDRRIAEYDEKIAKFELED